MSGYTGTSVTFAVISIGFVVSSIARGWDPLMYSKAFLSNEICSLGEQPKTISKFGIIAGMLRLCPSACTAECQRRVGKDVKTAESPCLCVFHCFPVLQPPAARLSVAMTPLILSA